MSTNPLPPNPSEDDLESLAEDLLGVDLSSSLLEDEPFEVEEFDLEDGDELDSSGGAEPTSEDQESAAESGRPTRSISLEVGDDFGSSILDEDEDPEPRRAVTSSERKGPATVEQPPPATEGQLTDEEESEDVEVEAIEDSDADEEDTYWDALDGWDWEEETGIASGEKPALRQRADRKAGSGRDHSKPESTRKTSELLDDSDFGAGLDDPGDADTGSAEGPSENTESGSRRRSRRRRRRSGADAKEQSVAPEQSSDVNEAEPSEEVDSFGAGLEVRETEEESQGESRRRSRSRRRRRRSSERTPEQAAADRPVDVSSDRSKPTSATDSADDDDEQADPEDKSSKARKYRNVPTWEEAIAFLVRPSTRRSSDQTGSEGQQRSGRGRSGSRRGGRRRGGRKGSSS